MLLPPPCFEFSLIGEASAEPGASEAAEFCTHRPRILAARRASNGTAGRRRSRISDDAFNERQVPLSRATPYLVTLGAAPSALRNEGAAR
ncbi:hypothetical protein GCM10011611_07150 [Aliidongia dinghuensis]|uniref:Uncharacterized protein n=1 Tax=Aliidongia dinghuensis TaxID=1867774 RepID=A0A8J2YPU7_9PROT|nr:hypothetical protein GCM10011611_07150 [Aliidongia dinghuensis]